MAFKDKQFKITVVVYGQMDFLAKKKTHLWVFHRALWLLWRSESSDIIYWRHSLQKSVISKQWQIKHKKRKSKMDKVTLVGC